LYAFGEPLLNPHFAKMVRLAKDRDVCNDIDTTTNASRLTHELTRDIIDAGLDRINISIVGVSDSMYKSFSKANVNFEKLVENIAYLYENKKQCTVFVKINGDVISGPDKLKFLQIFEPISDGCAIEHVMDCWDGYNMGEVEVNKELGVYGQPKTHINVCPYIFYSFCVNFDGVVSPCFLDWNRKMVIGNLNHLTLKQIWEGNKMRHMRLMMLRKQRSDLPVCANCNQLEAGEPVDIDRFTKMLLEKI